MSTAEPDDRQPRSALAEGTVFDALARYNGLWQISEMLRWQIEYAHDDDYRRACRKLKLQVDTLMAQQRAAE